MTLADGVLKTMMLKKLTVVGCVIGSLGIGYRHRRLPDPQGPGPGCPIRCRCDEATGQAVRPSQGTKPKDIDPLVQKLLDAARRRVEAQRAYYEEGRITIDRFVDALAKLEKAELMAAGDESERMAIRQEHLHWLKEVEKRELAEVQVGRGTVGDVAEASQRRQLAELDLRPPRTIRTV